MHEMKSFRKDCCRDIPRRLDGIEGSLPGLDTSTKIDLSQVAGTSHVVSISLKNSVITGIGIESRSLRLMPSSPDALLAILVSAVDARTVDGSGAVKEAMEAWASDCQ